MSQIIADNPANPEDRLDVHAPVNDPHEAAIKADEAELPESRMHAARPRHPFVGPGNPGDCLTRGMARLNRRRPPGNAQARTRLAAADKRLTGDGPGVPDVLTAKAHETDSSLSADLPILAAAPAAQPVVAG